MDKTQVNVKLDPRLLAKLTKLANATHRTRSDVLRLLLANARLADSPDITTEHKEALVA